MSLIPTAEYASLAAEAASPRLSLILTERPVQRDVLQHEEALVAQDSHIGGCLRGVMFAVLFQFALVSLCLLLFKIWRMMR